VQSRPALRTTLIDYGKNQENVKTIINYLSEHSSDAIKSEGREFVNLTG
jgi:hypothetical protein